MREYKFKVIERKDGEIVAVEFFSPAGRCIANVLKFGRDNPLQMTAAADLDESERTLVERLARDIFGERSESKLQELFAESRYKACCTLNYSEEKTLFFDVCKLPYPKAKPQGKHKRK